MSSTPAVKRMEQVLYEAGYDPDPSLRELIKADDRDPDYLQQNIFDLPGSHLLDQVQPLFLTLQIVNRNHNELMRTHDQYLRRGEELWEQNSMSDFDEIVNEYIRRLHNYVTSVYSLIEHGYTLLDRYEDEKPDFKKEYFSELRERDMKIRVDLIQQLRHYIQKRELPPLLISRERGTSRVEEGHRSSLGIHIDKSEMMDWDGWDPDVRERLEEWDNVISLSDFTGDYQQEINKFFDWFPFLVLDHFYDEIIDRVVVAALLEEEGIELDQRWYQIFKI